VCVECGEELEGALTNCTLHLVYASAERLMLCSGGHYPLFMETQQTAGTINEERT
jgi:hypothetical protein